MDICIVLIQNWQKKAWHPYVLIIILTCLSGLTLTASSGAIVHPPVAMETSPSPASLETAFTMLEPSHDTQEEEDWWEGVEEVDLTLPFDAVLVGDNPDDEGLGLLSNETDFWDLVDCDAFWDMSIPPEWGDMPPPPLPPVLRDLEPLLQEFSTTKHLRSGNKWKESDPKDNKEEEGLTEGECGLCEWATGGNQTLDYLAKRKSEADGEISTSMIGALIGVAFVSAAIGAAIMSILLKCKREGIHVACVGGSCPIHEIRRSGPKRSRDTEGQSRPEGTTESDQVKSEPSAGMAWALKRWRRSSSQAPLHLCSSPGSENSYVEEHYVNCDSNSAVYAELNSINGFVLTEPSSVGNGSNSYSEIPRPSELEGSQNSKKAQQRCDNEGYLSSETPPERNDSSVGSTSTPSSAYYSDVSSCEIAPKSRTRLTRDNEKHNVNSKQFGVSSISSQIDLHPVHLNLNAIPKQGVGRGESLPLTLQYLPKQLNVEPHRKIELNQPPQAFVQQQQTLNFPPSCIINNVTRSESDNTSSLHGGPPNFSSFDHYEGIYQDGGQIPPCGGVNAQRPLPPLPSRRVNGPKRKTINIPLDNGLTSLPSNYV